MSKRIKIKKAVLAILGVSLLSIIVWVSSRIGTEIPENSKNRNMQTMDTIAVFGATGKVGSGVLEAMMLNNDVNRIHVITRRSSPLIDEGVKSGSIEMTTHMDYTNYEALADLLKEVKSVYWALGTSALNVSDEQYSVIHVDFPLAFVKEWIRITGGNKKISFHLISGAGASHSSWFHWAREKARAEDELFNLARSNDNLRVISYRPGAVLTRNEGGFLNTLSRNIFVPLKMGIESIAIGEAMMEVTARGDDLPNGTILENRELLKYSNAFNVVQ